MGKLADLPASVIAKLLADATHQAKYGLTPGAFALNVLRVAANVANGETVTIDGQVFEVDIINTDAAIDTVGALDDSSDAVVVTFDGDHSMAAGDLFRVENEILKVLRLVTGSTVAVVAARGRCGTTIATHVTNSDVFVSDAAPAANIPVGLVTTLTPAVFTDALAAEINNAVTAGNKERATAKASTLYSSILASGPSDNEVLIRSLTNAALALATTETLAGVNNAWSAATMYGGLVDANRKIAIFPPRVPTAAEVALGNLYFPCDFTPRHAVATVRVTATGALKAWDGDIILAANLVTVNIDGSTDFAATDTVSVVAYE